MFPSEAEAFFQVALSVRRGVKGSRIVGIMCALVSLGGEGRFRLVMGY